jgi:hypothetical protein
VPTVFTKKGYRFFFYSLDRGEPVHVHVEHGRDYAKYWLNPVELARSRGFRNHQLHEIRKLIEEHRQEIENKWHEHFNR